MKILFLCTGNSCRSQMAEGWARKLKADLIEPYSAGIKRHGLNPHAVKVMAEAISKISNLDTIGRAGSFYYSHLHDQLRLAKDYVAALR